jgi:predicted phosphoribosyltransferase
MSEDILFRDRAHAGKKLSQDLLLAWQEVKINGSLAEPIVYALPRGGIPVALPIARALGCPLEVLVSKKISLPSNRELALGAISSDGNYLWSESRLLGKKSLFVLQQALDEALIKAKAQEALFASYCWQTNPQNTIAIVVDDGIATGMTMGAAVLAIRDKQAAQVWICAPVAPLEAIPELETWGDRVIVTATPSPFYNVSRFYEHFPQVETEEALAMLEKYRQEIAHEG